MLKKTLISLSSVLFLGIFASSAQALEFSFSKEGFEGGGTLSGMFSGDPGSDNFLSRDELTDFKFTFDDSTRFPSFSGDLSGLASFGYEVGVVAPFDLDLTWGGAQGRFISDDLRIAGLTFVLGEPSNPFGFTRSEATYTVEQKNTTPIPTPALLPGLIGLGFSAIRKRKLLQTEEA